MSDRYPDETPIFPINIPKMRSSTTQSWKQAKEPQSLGEELQQRADQAEIEGDDNHDIVGGGLNALRNLLGQDRETQERNDSAYDYRNSQLKHPATATIYIPPEQGDDYADADKRMTDEMIQSMVMGSAGGENPFKKPVTIAQFERPRIGGTIKTTVATTPKKIEFYKLGEDEQEIAPYISPEMRARAKAGRAKLEQWLEDQTPLFPYVPKQKP